jgi:hypothetical protein
LLYDDLKYGYRAVKPLELGLSTWEHVMNSQRVVRVVSGMLSLWLIGLGLLALMPQSRHVERLPGGLILPASLSVYQDASGAYTVFSRGGASRS